MTHTPTSTEGFPSGLAYILICPTKKREFGARESGIQGIQKEVRLDQVRQDHTENLLRVVGTSADVGAVL